MRENWKTIALALDKVVISVRSAFNIKTINILALIWISGRSLLSSTAFHSNAAALRGEWAMKVAIIEID